MFSCYELINNCSEYDKNFLIELESFLNLNENQINDELYFERYSVEKMTETNRKILISHCNNWLTCIGGRETKKRLYILSLLVAVTREKQYIIKMLLELNCDNDLTPEQLFFVFQQINSIVFEKPFLDSDKAGMLLGQLYKKVLDKYTILLSDEFCTEIPIENRDPNLIYVITSQFIEQGHGPTKSALDRCSILIRELGMKVLLINTAELLPLRGYIPLFDVKYGSYIEEYTYNDYVEWNGCKIPYFQCSNNMPDFDTYKILLENIRKTSPWMILEIGGGSLLASMASKMIPVLTNGMCTSQIKGLCTTAQTYGLPLSESDIKLLHSMGKDEKSVIRDTFTWKLPSKLKTCNREEYGIPEDKFAIAIIGARLDTDLSNDFLSFMEETVIDEYQYVLIGICNTFDLILQRHPKLDGHIIYLGFSDNVQGIVEQCDLYMNPPRRGGGFSAVEAMMQGIPAVSLPWGDVAVAVSEEFWVSDLQEMNITVEKYRTDPLFYKQKSNAARERANTLQDTEGQFVKTIMSFKNEFCKS